MFKNLILCSFVAAALAATCHENVALYADGLCAIPVAHLPLTAVSGHCAAQTAEGQSFSLEVTSDCTTITVYEGTTTCSGTNTATLHADGHCHKLCVGTQCGHYKIHHTVSLPQLQFPAAKPSTHLALRSFIRNPLLTDMTQSCKENITLYMDASCQMKVANLAMTLPVDFCLPNNGTGTGQEFAMKVETGCTVIEVYQGQTTCAGTPIKLTADGKCNEMCVAGQCGHYKIIESPGAKDLEGRIALSAFINNLDVQGKSKATL
jgi:hypothetical protein